VEKDMSLTTPEDAEVELFGIEHKLRRTQLKRLSILERSESTMVELEDAEDTSEEDMSEESEEESLERSTDQLLDLLSETEEELERLTTESKS
jgi:hypothetical protein